jgi:hypothetical protein
MDMFQTRRAVSAEEASKPTRNSPPTRIDPAKGNAAVEPLETLNLKQFVFHLEVGRRRRGKQIWEGVSRKHEAPSGISYSTVHTILR